MDKGTILYIGNFGMPNSNAAGKRVYGNARLLDSLGYKVLLVGKDKQAEVGREYQFDSISFFSFPNLGMRKTTAYIEWTEKLLSGQGIVPILVIRYGSPSLALFEYELYRWTQKRGIPLVVDVVDWLSADGGSIIFNVVKTIDTTLAKACFNKKGNGLIAISTYLANYYSCYGENRIILPPLVERYHRPMPCGSDVHIGYAGSPFRKNTRVKDVNKIKDRLDLAVKGLSIVTRKYSNVFFHIYGLTSNEYLCAFPEHKELVENSKNNILFHGMVPMDEVQNSISKMDFTILLRDRNRATMAGFPTKVVESLACCTPVITTDTSDLTKFIKTGENGFIVDISSVERLVDDLELIVSLNTDERQGLKIKCERNKSFLFENYRDQMTAFLAQIGL
jgi:glycosyltransferase involved in cell wall biosynthesis